MADLPDWYTLVSEVEAEAYSIRGGADVSKPTDPDARDVYLATDTDKLYYCIADGAWRGFFMSSRLLTANSLLYATVNYTPAALTVAASRIVGRKATGNLGALTGAEVMAILSGQATASFSMNSQKITDLANPTLAQDAATKDYIDSNFPTLTTFNDHSARHEDGGADEINIAGLAGEPAELATHKGLTTGVHGVGTGAIVGTTLTQTLTNKTLTSPTITDPSMTSPVIDTSLILKQTTANYTLTWADPALARALSIPDPGGDDTFCFLAATQTLTNKTIDANNNTISNLAHGAEVDNPTSGVHGVTGNVVGTSDTQTLTNKTLSTGSTVLGADDLPNTIANLLTDHDRAAHDALGTGTIVFTDETQTLINKTLSTGCSVLGADDLPNTIANLLTDHDRAAHDTLGTGTLVYTDETQTIINKTLTSPTIQGTVSAGTGLTMPANS